jgi:hypothetical protein
MKHSASSSKQIRLPVKFRYRSPVVFEFHVAGKRGASAYAQIWLQHLTDNEEIPIDIPIWSTKRGNRLTQNYITERNWKEVPNLDDLQEIGRLQFRARFKAGMDESHREFVVDNDSRETFETWEACLAEGVRDRVVEPDVPERVQTLHEKSLTEGRDVIQQASPEEKKRWLSKSGTDWSGAFGEDPKAYMDRKGRKIAEPGKDEPPHDPVDPSDDGENEPDDDDNDEDSSQSSSDIGIKDASSDTGKPSTDTNRTGSINSSVGSTMDGSSDHEHNKANKRTERRKQRGLMQWKPARNAAFAKDEAKFGLKKLQKKFTGGLSGREPKVETETGQ